MLKSLQQNYSKKISNKANNAGGAEMNIDKIKNVIGERIFNTILDVDKEVLEKWTTDCIKEISRETNSERIYRLNAELQLLNARLG
jgi:hypothetical protein